MSNDEKPKIDEAPRRYFKTHKNPVRMTCYLGIRRVTFGELREHLAEHYPEVDFDALVIGGLQLQWEDEPTPDERAQLARQQRTHNERQAEWERKTYERLKAKFEPIPDPVLEES